jgi:FixJ family two-component response regulator
MFPLVTAAFSSSWARYVGIALLCLTLGYTKGCSTGKESGRAEVQGKWDEYKAQIAQDLQENNVKQLEIVAAMQKAQSELAAIQSERRSNTDRQLAALSERLKNVFEERVTDPNCRYTADELRASQQAFDSAKNRRNKN